MIVVIGTPGSGKSAYAENLIAEIAQGEKMAYIATMEPYGEEGQARIERHRKLRADRNFVTFEEPLSMIKVADEILNAGIDTGLLECVSNLVGNVNINQESNMSEELLVEEIVEDIRALDERLKRLVVVTNYFESDDSYDEGTKRYIRINNAVNDCLKSVAQKLVEKEDGDWRIYENN